MRDGFLNIHKNCHCSHCCHDCTSFRFAGERELVSTLTHMILLLVFGNSLDSSVVTPGLCMRFASQKLVRRIVIVVVPLITTVITLDALQFPRSKIRSQIENLLTYKLNFVISKSNILFHMILKSTPVLEQNRKQQADHNFLFCLCLIVFAMFA